MPMRRLVVSGRHSGGSPVGGCQLGLVDLLRPGLVVDRKPLLGLSGQSVLKEKEVFELPIV